MLAIPDRTYMRLMLIRISGNYMLYEPPSKWSKVSEYFKGLYTENTKCFSSTIIIL
jgi:hypothetical protein